MRILLLGPRSIFKLTANAIMVLAVTNSTERNKVPFVIYTASGSRDEVMNIEVLPAAAKLAFPPIAVQHLTPERFVF